MRFFKKEKPKVPNPFVGVWLGYFPSEPALNHDFFAWDYADEDHPTSPFTLASGIKRYDEDFIESWWFDELALERLNNNVQGLPNHKLFWEGVNQTLASQELSAYNTISFLFGDTKGYGVNTFLANFNQTADPQSPIRFIGVWKYASD